MMRANARLRIGDVRMVWEPEIEELARRRALSAKGGTPDRIERQHNQGRLVVRERMEQLVDPGSLQEIGALAGEGTYEGTQS
jgi:acetyl-CoA carboxylase carboxyltransferase component